MHEVNRCGKKETNSSHSNSNKLWCTNFLLKSRRVSLVLLYHLSVKVYGDAYRVQIQDFYKVLGDITIVCQDILIVPGRVPVPLNAEILQLM